LNKEKARLENKRDRILAELGIVQKKLNNRDFVSKANEDLVIKVKGKKEKLESQIEDITNIINNL